MKASLSNHRQTPRKTRLVVDLIRGKTVAEALTILKFLPKSSAESVAKLIASAAANASQKEGLTNDQLVIKTITVDKGIVLKRFMPRARGSASRISRRRSHLAVTLAKK